MSFTNVDTLELADKICNIVSAGDTITLRGDVGAGKTFLTKHIISGLSGIDPEKISSPTFSLLQIYDTKGGFPIYHFDLYRIKAAEELYELGLEEAFDGTKMVIIEWPEIADKFIPKSKLDISITTQGARRIFGFNENMLRRFHG